MAGEKDTEQKQSATRPAPLGNGAENTAEGRRLTDDAARRKNWKRWGTYLPERQWGTVREDYSPNGDVWRYFTHEDARLRAYRWGEDGLLGWTDRECRLCFCVGLWNEKDAFLKERLFGLTGPEGNHGEDVKELYYYLDAMPTHSYCRALYKYPQRAFPYDELRARNRERGLGDPEFEINDTNVFDDGRYFDVHVEYAKAGENDTAIRITAHNRGPEAAPLHVLPQLWFRNTWIWGCEHEGCTLKPRMWRAGDRLAGMEHETLGRFHFAVASASGEAGPEMLFTENASNARALGWGDAYTPYVKDAFHRHVVQRQPDACNPKEQGTKFAAHYSRVVEPGASAEFTCRLWHAEDGEPRPAAGPEFDRIFRERTREMREYEDAIHPESLDKTEREIVHQSDAGLLWTKQFYHYSVADWLHGDPDIAVPPGERISGRNASWDHIFSRDVISMPDKWEFPWFAAWDLAFHMIPFARLDPQYAKEQLVLFLREWYMHPNGHLPAYEFAFSDVNPPVHAWACWRVYKMTGPQGGRDRTFLARVFHKLLINFTWWVNRKDPHGRNIFAGGFLGLDNIGVFDRSKQLPEGGRLRQADATAWVAFYCTTMLAMAMELAQDDPAYE
ncbi:MAG: MGH1-like glycoside hydrolase domain-containing protein, partial [Opitutaceae bacterium]